jgi:hypothetical protein
MWRLMAGAGLVLSGCLGGPMEQTAGCAAYVACLRATDAAAHTSTNVARFEPGGACWVNVPTGEVCATGCERGLAWLRARSAGLPAECAQ